MDCQRYDVKWTSIDWAGCTLRRWLNSEFYDKAFNEQERKCILKTRIVNNAGPKTEDCVFLLSVGEARNLFANDNARRARPTEYVAKNGVYINDYGYCWWWLRSRGYNDSHAACVPAYGSVHDYGSDVNHGLNAVRPAFKIAL